MTFHGRRPSPAIGGLTSAAPTVDHSDRPVPEGCARHQLELTLLGHIGERRSPTPDNAREYLQPVLIHQVEPDKRLRETQSAMREDLTSALSLQLSDREARYLPRLSSSHVVPSSRASGLSMPSRNTPCSV